MIVSAVEEVPSLESFASLDDGAGEAQSQAVAPQDAGAGEASVVDTGVEGRTKSPESQAATSAERGATALPEGLPSSEIAPLGVDQGEGPAAGTQ
jgi:hypothetical protein